MNVLVDACGLLVLGDAPAQGGLERESDDGGDESREGNRDQCDDRLHGQLLDPAAVEAGVGSEQADGDGPPQTGDQVDTNDIERVVIAEPVLEADGEARARRRRGRARASRRARARRGRRDGDEAGDDTEAAPSEVA